MLTRFFKGHQQRASNEKCQTINQKDRFIRNSFAVVDLFRKVVLPADDVYIRFQYNVVYWLLPAQVYNSVQYDLICALGISFNLGLSDVPYIVNMFRIG